VTHPLPDWLGQALPELVRDYFDPPADARARHFSSALARCAASGRVVDAGRHGSVVAVAGVEPLAWDTGHFGIGCARLAPVCIAPDLSPSDRRAAMAEMTEAAMTWCGRNDMKVLQRRIVGARADEASTFERRGFRLVDSIITLNGPAKLQSPKLPVRPARPDDRSALLAIAASAFPHSRFLADPSFDVGKARLVYVHWLETLLTGDTKGDKSGTGGVVLVAETNGHPAGFVAMRRDPQLDVLVGRPVAPMEMFAVAETARGQGLGTALLAAACDWSARAGAEIVEASTWTAATAARESYRRAGYVILDTLLTFHGRVS